jgi:hypothetical protein
MDDGPTRLARSNLDAAIYKYQDALARIDDAKIKLDLDRATLKYRYRVKTPAEVPRAPKKPIATIIGVGSFFAAVLLAFLLAAAADLAGGRVIETWQVRRRLKLEVLGDSEVV